MSNAHVNRKDSYGGKRAGHDAGHGCDPEDLKKGFKSVAKGWGPDYGLRSNADGSITRGPHNGGGKMTKPLSGKGGY